MLVLALQFSKGNGRGRTFAGYLTIHRWTVIGRANRTGRSVGSGSGAPCRAPRVGNPNWVDSLKTEEKTKLVEPACQEERILRLTCHFD
jgi:hypothetical protein